MDIDRNFRNISCDRRSTIWRRESAQTLLSLVVVFACCLCFSHELFGQGLLHRNPTRGVSTERAGRVTRKEAKNSSEISGIVRPGDELWVINTRSAAPGCTFSESLDLATTVYQKREDQFYASTASDLLGRINNDAVRENVVFIHGNRTDYRWARLRGTQTYEAIVDVTRCQHQTQFLSSEMPPVRWIIWSWPTDIIPGPKRDLAIKRQRAYDEGQLLALFLRQIEREEIGVLAYSLGAQALVSALCYWHDDAFDFATEIPNTNLPVEFTNELELKHGLDESQIQAIIELEKLETGDVDSVLAQTNTAEEAAPAWDLNSETVIDVQQTESMMKAFDVSTNCQETGSCKGPQLRIVMVAAAVPVDWFQSTAGRSCMSRCTASLTLINNPRDRVLEVYRKLTRLGPLGTQSSFAESLFPTIVHLVRNNALNNHVLTEYFASEQTRQQIRQALFPLK